MGLIWILATVLWGVAEATLFFIVPDVLLTFAAWRRGGRFALRLAVMAAGAASLAGIVMWCWGRSDPAGAEHVMLLIPAIGPDLLIRTKAEMSGLWPLHMLSGAVSGVPYKLYAIAAGGHHIALLPFVLASFVARLARFALSVGLAAGGAALLDRIGRPQWQRPLLIGFWILLYATYFALRA
ncbi:MAG: hypothetical protein P4L57_16340 [Rhizomicrobium sp.]|nr:hypothetical protein [Rhizomicrobium sp.]